MVTAQPLSSDRRSRIRGSRSLGSPRLMLPQGMLIALQGKGTALHLASCLATK